MNTSYVSLIITIFNHQIHSVQEKTFPASNGDLGLQFLNSAAIVSWKEHGRSPPQHQCISTLPSTLARLHTSFGAVGPHFSCDDIRQRNLQTIYRRSSRESRQLDSGYWKVVRYSGHLKSKRRVVWASGLATFLANSRQRQPRCHAEVGKGKGKHGHNSDPISRRSSYEAMGSFTRVICRGKKLEQCPLAVQLQGFVRDTVHSMTQ